MTSRIEKKPSKARKASRRGKGALGMPKSVIEAVRAIREDNEDLMQDRGHDRSYSCTEHALECSICGQLGEHACLPILHELIEDSEEFASICWSALKQMENNGFFSE